MTAEFQVIDLEIPPELAGQRLDSALARLLPQHSRTRIKGWIEDGAVLVGRQRLKPRESSRPGTACGCKMRAETAAILRCEPETIALRLVYEDADLLVIDKPAGLVVHPGAGNPGPYLAKCLVGIGLLAGERCRAPGSSIGWTRTPAACSSWRVPPRRKPLCRGSSWRAPCRGSIWRCASAS